MIEIQQLLAAQSIRSRALREEYLDHYCSQYERLIDDQVSHERAIYTIHQEISNYDFGQANRHYFKLHYLKPLIMTSTLLVLLATLFFLPSDDTALLVSDDCHPSHEHLAVLTSTDDPPSINPIVDGKVNVYSGFGMRMHPVLKEQKFHGGIDIRADIGTPIVAPSDGTIINAGYHTKKGNWIEIQHDEIYSTLYFHLSKIDVQINQVITKGAKIGEVGNTGASTAPHLHYEVIKGGKRVDPKLFLS